MSHRSSAPLFRGSYPQVDAENPIPSDREIALSPNEQYTRAIIQWKSLSGTGRNSAFTDVRIRMVVTYNKVRFYDSDTPAYVLERGHESATFFHGPAAN